MSKKERIIELKIEDDDLISGVDQISLVDEPAIEYDWIAFKKEDENFCIPEGDADKYLEHMTSIGESVDSLLEDGWVEVESTSMSKSDFAAISSSPNKESVFDTDTTRVRFRYGLNPIFKGQPQTIPTSRRFCREMVASNRVYRYEDIETADNGMNSSALLWRGSYNCRHNWFKVVYKQDSRIVNKASVNKGKIDGGQDYGDLPPFGQPSTQVTMSKEKFTLPFFENEQDAIDYSKMLECETGAHPHEVGGVTLWMPCVSHPEGMEEECGCKKEMDIDVSGLPPYVDEVPECEDPKNCPKKRDEFETYNDYPKAASENACKVLRWRDEHGDEVKGMTRIGWTRANQLCKGENISEETIARMSAFARHRKNAEISPEFKGTPWKDKGYVAWLGWGGTEGVEWASRKLDSIREDMIEPNPCQPGYEAIGTKRKDGRTVPNCVPVQNSKSVFKFNEEGDQYTLVGPAMVPRKKIIRRDEYGNEYFVYFSEETIKQISEKFMKRGYTRDSQHDVMHLGPGEQDVYVAESWIKEDENDKSSKYGFDELPVGTWFVKMKVNNKEVWEKVKSGELKGFSVSGYFEEQEVDELNAELFLTELAKLLS